MAEPALKLSILDQSPVHGSETPADALRRTIELAQRAEEWGYHRFWVAEHHGSDRVMGSSPEILVSHLLAHTSTIRIGSGGVMLQHYSPYKVAENFNVLASLAPGRVDLGIGRGPGGLPRSTAALRRGVLRQAQDEKRTAQDEKGTVQDEGRTAQDEKGTAQDEGQGEFQYEPSMTLAEKLTELRQFLHNKLDPGHPLYGLQASPLAPQPPELFLLGTTRSSGDMAAELTMPYVFALFLNNDEDEMAEAVRRYQSGFALRQAQGDGKNRPSSPQTSPEGRRDSSELPYTMLALPIIVADTDIEAAEHAAKIQVVRIRLGSGRTLTVGSVEAGEEFGRQSGEGYEIIVRQAGVVHGTPESVRSQLLDVQRKYGAGEIIAVTAIDSFEKRLRSFELLGGLIRGLNDTGP